MHAGMGRRVIGGKDDGSGQETRRTDGQHTCMQQRGHMRNLDALALSGARYSRKSREKKLHATARHARETARPEDELEGLCVVLICLAYVSGFYVVLICGT